VVLDTLGINGARAATPLAWDERSFVALFKERRPDLVVLAYGTNEVFAAHEPERYHDHFTRLLKRLRRSQVPFDCLLLGPTDVAAPGGGSHPRVAPIDQVERAASEQLGCAYFSLYQAMGGEGSAARWAAERPPLAAKDGVHLTPRGYEEIGARIADVLLAACE
jgi:lysophospholipase L1-like esterase